MVAREKVAVIGAPFLKNRILIPETDLRGNALTGA